MGWLSFIFLLNLALMVFFIALGDILLTFILRFTVPKYVGRQFRISWSLRTLSLRLSNMQVDKSVVPALAPLVGLPVQYQSLQFQNFNIQLAGWANLNTFLRDRNTTLQSIVEFDGLQVKLSLDDALKWVASYDENAERFQQSVQEAAKARLAKLQTMTATVIQKLTSLSTLRQMKKDLETNKSKEKELHPETRQIPVWKIKVDQIIDAFAFRMADFKLVVDHEDANATCECKFSRFNFLPRANAKEKRSVTLKDFEVTLSPNAEEHWSVIKPMDMNIDLEMPNVMQNLLDAPPNETRSVNVAISFPRNVIIQVRPQHVKIGLNLLRPLTFYNDWSMRALTEDESRCKELEGEEREEYLKLYKEEHDAENAGFVMKTICSLVYKKDIASRRERLKELEAKGLSTRLLFLRSRALKWDIPSPSEYLPNTSEDIQHSADLRKFLSLPLDTYEAALPAEPMLHLVTVSILIAEFELQLVNDTGDGIMNFFTNEIQLVLKMSLVSVDATEHAMKLSLDITRFGLRDVRNSPKNVFRTLLDRNPGADKLVELGVTQYGDGSSFISIALKDLSFLVVFDPLLYITQVISLALEADEDTEMKFLRATCEGPPPKSVEEKEATRPVYMDDLPKQFTPLFLAGQPIAIKLVMTKCEICFLGDSTTLSTHVLALTSDINFQLVSSSQHEAMELELTDVAFQPCTVKLVDDGIEMVHSTGRRSILELEGEGVDLAMGYRLSLDKSGSETLKKQKLEAATDSSDGSQPPSSRSSAVSHWNIARKAVQQKRFRALENSDSAPVSNETLSESRKKPEARRKVTFRMSDFVLNLAPSDVGVFLDINDALTASMAHQSKDELKALKEKKDRLEAARKDMQEKIHQERLKKEFKRRDIDGGGSLDREEIQSLLSSVSNNRNLTATELQQTVDEFISIVDADNSGTISLEEFEAALKRDNIIYPLLHVRKISLLGSEYVYSQNSRNRVPAVNKILNEEESQDTSKPYRLRAKSTKESMYNQVELKNFWVTLEKEVGISRTSLEGLPPKTVQKKMVRCFRNYEYAQEAWRRLVQPSLSNPADAVDWLLTPEMDMESRGNVIDQLLSSFDEGGDSIPLSELPPRGSLFIQTTISTSMGGFYIHFLDDMLPMGVSAIELCFDDFTIFGNFSMYEGPDQPDDSEKSAFGVGKLHFGMYGNYYNTRGRQTEPFLEKYGATLDVNKLPNSHLAIHYDSESYLQLNVTTALMSIVNTSTTHFTSAKSSKVGEDARKHISEFPGGLFWILNETGVNISYVVVSRSHNPITGKESGGSKPVSRQTSVNKADAHPAVLIRPDEDRKKFQQQEQQEKKLRKAFRKADVDGSGELNVDEVATVLDSVFGENDNNTMEQVSVDEFMEFADTDKSGQVSWDEFKTAIAKTRKTSERYVYIEVEGYELVRDISVSAIGTTQVFELIPYFDDLQLMSIEDMYEEGVRLLNEKTDHSTEELQRIYACLRGVKDRDPKYDWIDSHLASCLRVFAPRLLAIKIIADGNEGLQVKVMTGEMLKNNTRKTTEVQLLNGSHEIADINPEQHEGKEQYFILEPCDSLPIPLDLIDVGYFAIRQVGETEWSNQLPLSVQNQRKNKVLNEMEKALANNPKAKAKSSRKMQTGSNSSKSEKSLVSRESSTEDGEELLSRQLKIEYVAPGTETKHISNQTIDNQPTSVIETASSNSSRLATWTLTLEAQLVLENLLPCGVEYAIVQARDCPEETLESANKDFQCTSDKIKSSSKSKQPLYVSLDNSPDYFEYVDEVNSRRLYVESGKSVEVFGLDLEAPALMKMRLCGSESNRSAQWSAPFLVNLHTSKEGFNATSYEVNFPEKGPTICFAQQWSEDDPVRTVRWYVPYWIHDRSGLDLCFKLKKGTVCDVDDHRNVFQGTKEMPMLVISTEKKAVIRAKPFRETPYEYREGNLGSTTMKSLSPQNFSRLDWSDEIDMSQVGKEGELKPSGDNDYSFVLSYEIVAAPNQFFRTKILIISPRAIVLNKTERRFHLIPTAEEKRRKERIALDLHDAKPTTSASAKLKAQNKAVAKAEAKSSLTEIAPHEAVAIYRFEGQTKHGIALRLRDITEDSEDDDESKPWSSAIPIKNGIDYNFWARKQLGNGPALHVDIQTVHGTSGITITDSTNEPRYRIENRSTTYAFRYVQNGTAGAKEIDIPPMTSHTFMWDDPLVKNLRLRVTPMAWKSSTLVNFWELGRANQLMPRGLYTEVYIDGYARVCAIGDTTITAAKRRECSGDHHIDLLSTTDLAITFPGIGVTIIDDQPREIVNISLENVQFTSELNSRACVFALHHFQIDDMTENSQYPVVITPLDSGFNSDKREDWLPQDGERPWLRIRCEVAAEPGIPIVNDLSLDMRSLQTNINLEFWLGAFMNAILDFVPGTDKETLIRQGIELRDKLLTRILTFPDRLSNSSYLFYFKRWKMEPYEFHLNFDSSSELNGEGISQYLGATMGSIVGGIAHITPEFHFDEILFENRFFYDVDLMYEVMMAIVFCAVKQWYKVVGSVEMLGDPVGFAQDVRQGLALTMRQVKREISGRSTRKGESALTLIQSVVGAPSNAISKASNSMGDVVKKATHFGDQEMPSEPRHLPAGVWQGGILFSKSIGHGVAGLVKQPVKGAKSNGAKGFMKGLGRGGLQLAASPLVGTLGAVEKVSQSVNNMTHLLDEPRYSGVRRPARDLSSSPLRSLTESNVITEVELMLSHIEGLGQKMNTKVITHVYTLGRDGIKRDMRTFKSSKRKSTATPAFNESWLVSVTSSETVFELHVVQSRKPLPHKTIGIATYSLSDIYNDFEGVSSSVLSNVGEKLVLKRRKKIEGSALDILNRSRSISAPVNMEPRDDEWLRMTQIRAAENVSLFLEDEDSDTIEDDFDANYELLASSQSMDHYAQEDWMPKFVPVQLSNSESNAILHLSFRYVNDMKRYV